MLLQVVIDGVTYLAAPHEPVVELIEAPPAADSSPELARAAVEQVLAALTGVEVRLRAGFAAVRALEVDARGGGAWRGPAYLFSFEARTAGAFELTYAGEDPSDWPAPGALEGDDDGGGSSASSSASSSG